MVGLREEGRLVGGTEGRLEGPEVEGAEEER